MNKCINFLKYTVLILSTITAVGTFNASADTLSATGNTQSESVYAPNYGVFEYTAPDSLIKSVKLLDKFGFNSAVVSETLNLNSYQGSVIIFKPDVGGKALSYDDVFDALKKYMKPIKFSETDAIVVKNTPLSVNEGGAMIKQDYQVLFNGESAQGTQPFQIPEGGLALTVVKMNNGKLLLITTTP
ncbi:hypothetical protein I5398_22770 [Citrobacter freundii]|nr:hypothetical protein [Citrobacter freundii]